MPMTNATMVRRGIELLPDESVKISPSKLRLVRRAVAKSRARVLLPFSMGEKLKGDEGSMNRLSEKIFLKDRIAEHNSGGKHLELHEPVCLGYQYGAGVVYGTYTICLAIVNRESAEAYETMYTVMQGGVFQLAHDLKLCKSSASTRPKSSASSRPRRGCQL